MSSSFQRYTRDDPCPICGHHATDRDGHCHGGLTDNGAFARCGRADGSDGAMLDEKCSPAAYVYKRTPLGSYRPWTECPPTIDSPSRPARTPAHRAPDQGGKTHPRPASRRTFVYSDTEGVEAVRSVAGGKKDCYPRVRDHADAPWRDGTGITPNERIYQRADLNAHPDERVYIVEGEGCADALHDADVLAITWRGGCGQVRQAIPQIVEAVRGHDVVLLSDADEPGRDAIRAIAMVLRGIAKTVRIVNLYDDESGRDVEDWLHEGGTVHCLTELADGTLPDEADADTAPGSLPGPPKTTAKRPPQRDDLIALADDAELFHTPQGIPYATFAVGSHRETHRLTSRGFREWLAHRYYREHGGSANTQAVQDACTALAGRARYDGPEHPVFIRLADHEGAIYLDLCDAAWRVVAIDAEGWRIVTDAPVRFRRTRGMLALPTPIDAGTLETLKTLRRFFNLLPEADWILIQAALIAAMRPRGPYPILAFRSEQGSGKSTRMKMMRSLIDPNTAPLRTMPRDERDLMIAATNGHYMNFDNVSAIPAWLSDALCRLSTGGGFATREMYADDDETILDAQRPILLNGITDFATRSDLLDRLIVVDLPRIPDSERQTEAALWLAFEQERPAIIGALLTAVSAAIRNLPTTTLATMPRMADFALWVTAAAPALGWQPETFLAAYTKNRANAHELAIESSLVAATLIRFIEHDTQWEGRASDLLAALTSHADEATGKHRDWPKDATRLSSELRRLAPNLRAVGVGVDWPKARTIRLAWTGTPRQEERGKSALSALSALSASWDADEASNSNGNEDNAIAGDSVTGAQASVIHNADRVADDAAEDTASRHEANAGTGNNADNADNAEKPPLSSSRTTSRPITDRDLPNIFPGYRQAATNG